MSYRKNYDSKSPNYWNTYKSLNKRDLGHLLQTGLFLTPDKNWKPGTGNYRDFPDKPDFVVPEEKVPLLHGKPIPLERPRP